MSSYIHYPLHVHFKHEIEVAAQGYTDILLKDYEINKKRSEYRQTALVPIDQFISQQPAFEAFNETDRKAIGRLVYRLSAIHIAHKLRNVSKACRLLKMDRRSFYDWKERYDDAKLAGLVNKVSRSMRKDQEANIINTLVNTALSYPELGSAAVSKKLFELHDLTISSSTVHNRLVEQGLATKKQRLAYLEYQYIIHDRVLSEHQMSIVSNNNPGFNHRDEDVFAPFNLLLQDTIPVGENQYLGKICVHVAVDAYSGYAFALMSHRKQHTDTIKLLALGVEPVAGSIQRPIQTILTDSLSHFQSMPYQRYLKNKAYEHLSTPSRTHSHGVLQFFIRHVKEDFKVRERVYSSQDKSLHPLQAELTTWVNDYNRQQQKNYPMLGMSPQERLITYRDSVQHTAMDTNLREMAS